MPHVLPHPEVRIITINRGCCRSHPLEDLNLTRRLCNPFIKGILLDQVIQDMTGHILRVAVTDPILKIGNYSTPVLVPVLRGAFPMGSEAQRVFRSSDTMLVHCPEYEGMEGGGHIRVKWIGRNTDSGAPDLVGKDILLMDTTINTGENIRKLCDVLSSIVESAGLPNTRRVTVALCYAGFDAIDLIAQHSIVKGVIVGTVANWFDREGHLRLSTNGDIGDRLYGKMAEPPCC